MFNNIFLHRRKSFHCTYILIYVMLAFTTDVGYPALIYTPSYIVRASSGTLKVTQLVGNIIERRF